MAIEKIAIDQFLELAGTHPLIDVRSPGEYKHAHIPRAISLSLFTDEERKIVGTTYKQQSRELAIKTGLDFFGPKMRKMVEEVNEIFSRSGSADQKILLIYCWRGGMRSAAVSWLMDLYGYKVYTLAGGYKKFRGHVLETFQLPFQINILGGYTGSGKTELLKALREKGEKIIDLESLALHKGSAFGNIGMPPQPTQEMFENLLSTELNTKSIPVGEGPFAKENGLSYGIRFFPIWLEDESQRIGHINIPHELWKTMRRSPLYFLDIPFEERLNHIVSEYGCLDRQMVIDAILRIREKLGGQHAKSAIAMLEEGNTVESFRILLEYYDRFYFKALHNREEVNSLLQRIECKSVTPENAIPLIHQSRLQQQKI